MFSWWFPTERSKPSVPEMPKFYVTTPVGEVPAEDYDRVVPAGGFLVGRSRLRGFIREGEDRSKSEVTIIGKHSTGLIRSMRYRTRSVGYSIATIGTILWILNVPHKGYLKYLSTKTHAELSQDYSCLCMNAIRVVLKNKLIPHPWNLLLRGLDKAKALMLYRSRRCTAQALEADPLKFVQSFSEPLPPNVSFSSKEYKRLGDNLFKARKINLEGNFITPFQSGKSGMLLSQSEGGFNRAVGLLADQHPFDFVPLIEIPKNVVYGDEGLFLERPMAQSFYIAAVKQRNDYTKAFNHSLGILLKLKRPLLAYSVHLRERGNKDRVPNIPEEFAQIVAKGIGNFGLQTLEQLFPVEFRGRGRVKMKKNDWYKSGDYKDSTSYIYWQAGRVAWDIILDHSRLPKRYVGLFKLAIKKLIGEHIIFADRSVRYKMLESVYPQVRSGYPSELLAYAGQVVRPDQPSVDRDAIVSLQDHIGSAKGTLSSKFLERTTGDHDTLMGRLEGIESLLPINCVRTVRGILMSYGIAVSALFILNALPHWGFETLRKGARFFCKGDDNASSHRGKPTGTMASLEKKKAESGMQVHTKVKAFESTVGFILAEELYLEAKKKTYLERVPNFPIRALFPEAHDSFSFIAVPSSIRSQLKELQDGNCLARITQLLMCRYSKEYEGLRKMGVSVTGEHSIITWASDDGFPYNSKTVPGLYQRPVISGDYSSDCDIGDFVTAKKGFGADVDDSILPYMSHRMTEEKVRATLSTVPLISPYRRQPPYTKVPIGGVDSIGENLEKGLSKLRRQVETYPEIPLVGPTRHLQRKVKSSEGFRNPFDLENWTYKGFIPPGAVNNTGLPIAKPYDSDDSDDELFEPVENGIRLLQMATDHLPKRSLGGLHSDIRSLANGVAPVSHPLEPMSFEGLSTIPYHVILDMRNNFPKSFFERDESSSRGTTSKMAKHVSKLIMERFKKEWYTLPSPRVYWAVLEQPGTPRAVHITMSVLLVLSRPSRHNLGADSEVEYVTRKLWALGRKPIVFTHDKELQSRVRKVFK